jgi:hypothetical protein
MTAIIHGPDMPDPDAVRAFSATGPQPASSADAIQSVLDGGKIFSREAMTCRERLVAFCQSAHQEIQEDVFKAANSHGAYMNLEEESKVRFKDIDVPILRAVPETPREQPVPELVPNPLEIIGKYHGI